MTSLGPDKLDAIFTMQHDLMYLLRRVEPGMPDWPIDPSCADSQRFCRDIALRATEELHEALVHLKSWKAHRTVDGGAFDVAAFSEELIDALTYIIELAALVGVDAKELYTAFCMKNATNMLRAQGRISALRGAQG